MRRFAKAPFCVALALAGMPLPAVRAAGEAPQGRLPDDAVPQAYRVDLTVDPSQDRFTGHVEIDIATKTAQSRFAFDRFLRVGGQELKWNLTN